MELRSTGDNGEDYSAKNSVEMTIDHEENGDHGRHVTVDRVPFRADQYCIALKHCILSASVVLCSSSGVAVLVLRCSANASPLFSSSSTLLG